MKCLQELVPPDQKRGTIHTGTALEFSVRRANLHTDQKPMPLPRPQFTGSKNVPLHFWFSRALQKSGGEKRWNVAVICETYKTNWQTHSHRTNENVAPFDGPYLYEGQKSSSTICGQGCFQNFSSDTIRILEEHAWTRDLIIADRYDIEMYVVSEVHVTRFKSEEVGIKNLQEAFIFLCAHGSLRQEGHAQHQTSRHQRVESFDGEARRGVTHCSAQRVTLCKKKAELQTLFEADRDAMEGSEDFWS